MNVARPATLDIKDREAMTAQDNVALARSLLDLYNNRRSDPAWLDKAASAFAEDSEYIDIPSGATLRGPYGYRRLLQFFAEDSEYIDIPSGATLRGPYGYRRLLQFIVEGFPDSRVELINAFAEEDQVTLETTARWNNIEPKHLPPEHALATGRSTEMRMCQIFQIRNGKIVKSRTYYDMTTLLEQFHPNSAN